MKKAFRFTLIALIIVFSIFSVSGCDKKEDKVTSVTLKNYDPNTAIEIASGAFDFGRYAVVVTYESGNVEEIPLTDAMISETDLFKLYQIGDHDIVINYGEQKYTFKVSVKRSRFGELSLPQNNVFTYDGKEHTVEVDGEIPANAVVTYIGGNSFVNVGTYDVIAIVSCEGYVTEKLSTTVKIERAKYDMSHVKFEGKEVVYDGNNHSLAISGTLPEGVKAPTYTINGKTASGATDAGEYKVKATFTSNDPNYEAIPDMEAILKIIPAEYTVKGVDIIFKNESGDIISNATKIYDGKTVSFDLNDYNQLSKKLSVSFSVCDKDGTVISTSNQKTGIVNAGVYTVKIEFTMADSKNYQPIPPMVSTFEVLKAEYPPLENIQFTPVKTVYDGKEHSIEIKAQLPTGVKVVYEYYKDGVRVDDSDGNPVKSVIDAGRYTVKAVFSHSDINRKEISPISATLHIEQAKINILELGFEYNKTWVYDGTPKSVVTSRSPKNVNISYEYYLNGELVKNPDGSAASSVTEVGDYTVKVIISATNNYATVDPINLSFSIVAQNN